MTSSDLWRRDIDRRGLLRAAPITTERSYEPECSRRDNHQRVFYQTSTAWLPLSGVIHFPEPYTDSRRCLAAGALYCVLGRGRVRARHRLTALIGAEG